MVVDNLFLNLAYVVLLVSTFTQTVRRLRLLLISASVCLMVFGFAADLPAVVAWNLAIGGLHTYRVVRDIQAERSIRLSDDQREIRDLVFEGASDFDFHLLWSMGRQVTYDDETIISAGTRPETIGLILDGSVQVVGVANGLDRALGRGSLIGEMSFVSGEEAAVDVVASDTVTMREWIQQDIDALSR
ncbi:MAG: cyclic nucleotide-binding domain-containing protein, partial [Actinomycetota bacterium]